MIVYMTRKHRRALRDLMREQFGDDDLPRGSRETLRAALDYLWGAIEESDCYCDDCRCPERGSVVAELDLAERFTTLLLAAHPRWRLRETRLAVEFRRGFALLRWRLSEACRLCRTPRRSARSAYRRRRFPMTQVELVQVMGTATTLVSAGGSAQVKAALAALGQRRVSELSSRDVPAFLAALAP